MYTNTAKTKKTILLFLYSTRDAIILSILLLRANEAVDLQSCQNLYLFSLQLSQMRLVYEYTI